MTAIMSVAKPSTPESLPYLEYRWKAALASVAPDTSRLRVSTLSVYADSHHISKPVRRCNSH